MIGVKKVLAVIPARGGSKGVPGKNIRVVGGKPLIEWTIEEGKKSRYIDRLILSSDDEKIIQVALEGGCEVPFVRPAELALDDTPGIEPVIHTLKQMPGYDYIVLLQPTSPFRTAQDIDACLEMCFNQKMPACVSVTEPNKSPYWMYSINEDNCMVPVIEGELVARRQELPKAYALNGAVYVAETEWLQLSRSFLTSETVAYDMPYERSLDIDTEFDLKLSDFLLSSSKG